MAVQANDRIPEATFKVMGPNGMEDLSTTDLCAGKKVVLFAVPGALTPTCSEVHMPGFIDLESQIRAKGVDTIACVAVNDAFVMREWRKLRSIPEEILLLSDGNGDFTRAMGLELDASRFGMGTRSRRYAAIVDDGVIKTLNVEPAGEVGVSSAQAILEALG